MPDVAATRTDILPRHDNIAALLGITAAGFEDEHRDAVMGIRRLLLDYVTRLQDALAGVQTEARPDPLVSIQVDESGWPVLVGFDEGKKWPKEQLEIIIRAYLSRHYGE